MAMQFGIDGDERILVPQASQLDMTSTISLCSWVNVQGTLPSPGLAWSEYMTKNDFYVLHYSAVEISSEFGFNSAGGWRLIHDGVFPTTGEWFHSCGTYDQSASGNNFTIYRNGTLADSTRYTNAILTTATGLSIASLNASRYFPGLLEDCRIYNRALSANEVATIYASQGQDSIYYGLVAKYSFDEGYNGQVASGTILDYSNYKNDGTAYGNPVWTDHYVASHKGRYNMR